MVTSLFSFARADGGVRSLALFFALRDSDFAGVTVTVVMGIKEELGGAGREGGAAAGGGPPTESEEGSAGGSEEGSEYCARCSDMARFTTSGVEEIERVIIC